MRKTEDYRKQATECRRMAAANPDPAARRALLKMAETWDSLAIDREINVARKQRIEKLDAKKS
jgi:hypothetical protein